MQGTPLLPPLFGTAALKDTGTTEDTVPLRTVNGALVGPMAWSELTNTPTTLSGYGITDAATSAQGSLADTAVQPGDLATVATTGSYNDLLNKPTITTGTVESVGLALPSQFTVTGSPVTSTGTLTAAWASQTQAHVLAAPSDGNGTPAFRALVATDIPTLNQNTTGTAANVTGTVAIVNGGTGATTDADARTNLGLAIGTNIQAYDADLGAIAALTTTGLIDRTGAGTATTRTTGTTGLAVLAAADADAARTAIGAMANTAPEIITNANGTAYRWPNGLQICSFTGELQNTTLATGALFIAATAATWTFPASFNLPPAVYGSQGTSTARWVGILGTDGTSVSYRQISATSISSSSNTRLVAIGTYTP
jgi:hypothetical protein